MKYTKEQKKELEDAGKIVGTNFFISYAKAGAGPTGDETAIVIEGSNFLKNKYYILNGNWLEQYRPLVTKGLKACKKLFNENKETHINPYSDIN